jgi:hypothetical protein
MKWRILMIENNIPRAKTEEEVRREIFATIRGYVNYWANLPDNTSEERCDGLAFSILNIFDGTTVSLPAMNISLSPHPDDMLFNKNNGENWYEPGMIINDCCLHEEYYK